MAKPTFGKVSPTKHSGAEMHSAENNPAIDRGHGREDQENMQTIIANRLKDEKSHDDFHTKNGPSHDVTPSWEKKKEAPLEMNSDKVSPIDDDKMEMNRQMDINSVDGEIETLEEQLFNEEITQAEYDMAMKEIRPREKNVKQPLEKNLLGRKYEDLNEEEQKEMMSRFSE